MALLPAVVVAAASLQTPSGELEAAVQHFLVATTPAQRASATQDILGTGATFEDVFALLRRGRAYAADAPRGRILKERAGVGGVRHPYMILVPEEYTPDRTWPVRVDMHGGMGAKEWKKLDGSWNAGWSVPRDFFVVLPAGWWDSMWWEWSQMENLHAILSELKRTWNVDEDRIVMYGGSDGGAAAFFHAFRDADPWCGYAGHVAPPDRLARAEFRVDGQMHLSNLAGQRFHLGYGEDDPKCPIEHIRRYMRLFQDSGADIDWYAIPDQGHALSLSTDQERALGRFLFAERRDALPDRLSWATERTDRYNRRSWLVIDELQPAAGRSVDENNVLPRWGTRIQLRGPTVPRVPWGRVELERDGNTVRATTRGVQRFTLLVSPDELDLDEPVVVEVDGEVLFEAKVQPSVGTLLRWAAEDEDRSLLFAAEIPIVVRG